MAEALLAKDVWKSYRSEGEELTVVAVVDELEGVLVSRTDPCDQAGIGHRDTMACRSLRRVGMNTA